MYLSLCLHQTTLTLDLLVFERDTMMNEHADSTVVVSPLDDELNEPTVFPNMK